MSNAVIGIISSSSLAVHLIGQGLSCAKGCLTKHDIKQVDRLLSNVNFDLWAYFYIWIPQIISSKENIIVAMDWTEFDKDNHTTIAIYMVTKHGRATPLIWKTHSKDNLKNNQNKYEKEILNHLKKTIPQGVGVTVLADRGFGNIDFYKFLSSLGFEYIVRFKSNIYIEDAKGIKKIGKEWVGKNGRAKRLTKALVTKENPFEAPVIVCVQEKDMKDIWCLVSSDQELTTKEIINLYGKRWSIETKFRDQKNLKFGMGMYSVIIKDERRRDRLFFLGAIADLLLTILGAAGEEVGFDKYLKANTVKRRVHSLYRQGCMWYELIPNMKQERLEILMKKFSELLEECKATKEVLSFV
jgi:hypothetical protein